MVALDGFSTPRSVGGVTSGWPPQHINFLLTGTGWSTKAEEVMTRVFAQMREHSEKYEVHIGTLNNNGTLNEISGSSVFPANTR